MKQRACSTTYLHPLTAEGAVDGLVRVSRGWGVSGQTARALRTFVVAWVGLTFGYASPAQPAAKQMLIPFSNATGSGPPAPWHFSSLPGKKPTRFDVVSDGGQRVLKVEADDAYGNLAHPVDVAVTYSTTLSWRWRVGQLPEAADIRARATDDSAIRLCLFFDLSVSQLSLGERASLALARKATGENLPAEALCYAWDNRLAKGTIVDDAFSKRLRLMVLRSGIVAAGSGAAGGSPWMSEQRNVAADYQHAFGLPAASPIPRLVDVVVSGDADSTHGHTVAWLGDLALSSAGGRDLASNASAASGASASAPEAAPVAGR